MDGDTRSLQQLPGPSGPTPTPACPGRCQPHSTPPTGSLSSGKASQDRKLTSTPREIAKSPHSAVPEHHPHPISPYEHLLRGVSGVDLYRGHIPLAFDPTSIPRGIPLDAGDRPGPAGPEARGQGVINEAAVRGSRGPELGRPSGAALGTGWLGSLRGVRGEHFSGGQGRRGVPQGGVTWKSL